jgi:hypothetical protein
MDATIDTYPLADRPDPRNASAFRVRDRLIARWRSMRLDRALAQGTPPEASGALLLRARALVAPRTRRDLGRALERILAEPAPAALIRVRVPVRRREVTRARDDLRLLAQRLAGPAPVDVRGVAQVRVLLSDGSGPLFWRRSADELSGRVREAIQALDLQAPHEPAPAGGRERVR